MLRMFRRNLIKNGLIYVIIHIVRIVEFGCFGKKHLNVQVLQVHEQYMHCKVQNLSIDLSAIITVVYAKNELNQREK